MPGLCDSLSFSALSFPASLRLPSSGTHSWITYCLLTGRLLPSPPWVLSPGDGGSLGMWVGTPGAEAAGQRPQCGTARVLSRAQTHDWMSENASYYPTHRAQRGHAGARRARRLGWVHGGSGSPPQRARMCPESRGQLLHAGMRTISSSPREDKDGETDKGSPQARAGYSS